MGPLQERIHFLASGQGKIRGNNGGWRAKAQEPSKSTSFEKSGSSYSELTLTSIFVQFDAECGSAFDSIGSCLPTIQAL